MLVNNFKIAKNVYIAKSAQLHGNITILADSSVWDNVVIRADFDKVVIGIGTNIQDNATLHVDKGFPVKIGNFVTVGHNAVVHGASIADNCLIGINSTVLNGARIGKNCLIGAGALIMENQVIPDNSIVIGLPGKVVKRVDNKTAKQIRDKTNLYIRLAKSYFTTTQARLNIN